MGATLSRGCAPAGAARVSARAPAAPALAAAQPMWRTAGAIHEQPGHCQSGDLTRTARAQLVEGRARIRGAVGERSLCTRALRMLAAEPCTLAIASLTAR